MEKPLLVDTETQILLAKWANKMIDSSHDKYSSSIFLVEKKDSSQRPVINLKSLNQHIAYEHFRMEWFYLLGELQGKLERCILRCSIARRITEFCMFWVERQTLSICLSLFQLDSSPSSFHRTDENSNSYHKEVEWEHYNLSRQHLDNDNFQGSFIDIKRYSHFSSPELGLCHQLQDAHFLPMPFFGIIAIGNRFSEYDGGTYQYQPLLLLEKVSVRDLAKLTGRLSSTVMTVLPAPLQYRGLQQQ